MASCDRPHPSEMTGLSCDLSEVGVASTEREILTHNESLSCDSDEWVEPKGRCFPGEATTVAVVLGEEVA